MSDNPNNIYGSIQNMMGGSIGYTRFLPAPGDEIQISGKLNVITDRGVPADIQMNGTSISVGIGVVTQVVIQQLSDFPTPVAGVISLESNTNYYVQGTVDISPNTIDFAGDNASIRGVEKRITTLTTNNATLLIQTTTTQSFSIKDITLEQTGAGDLMEIIISTNARVSLDNTILLGGALIGNTGGVLEITHSQLQQKCTYIHRNNGINILDFESTSFSDSGAAGQYLLDFETGTQTATITIENCFLIVFSGGTALRAVTPDLLLNSSLNKCTFTGTGTLFSGMSQASNSWYMSDNINIPTSNTGGSLDLVVTGPPKLVIISTPATYTDISGTDILWNLNSGNEKFSLNNAANGEFIYTGTRDMIVKVGGYLTFERDSVGDNITRVGIAVNGTIVVPSQVTTELDTQRIVTSTVPVSTTNISTGDTIKVMIQNSDEGGGAVNDVKVSYGSLVLFNT